MLDLNKKTYTELTKADVDDSIFRLGAGGAGRFSGVPIRRVSSVSGRQTPAEITGAVRQTFPESTFTWPADFQKSKLPGQ